MTGKHLSQASIDIAVADSAQAKGDNHFAWRENLLRVEDKSHTFRPVPRDCIEIFGATWGGGSGKGKERNDFEDSDHSVYNSKLSIQLIQARSMHDHRHFAG